MLATLKLRSFSRRLHIHIAFYLIQRKGGSMIWLDLRPWMLMEWIWKLIYPTLALLTQCLQHCSANWVFLSRRLFQPMFLKKL
nr:hypothetical protein Iba_chr08aCG6250 [Ipomoea batatas]